MAISQTSSDMTGMPSNSGLLIRACDYATGEGELTWNATYNYQGVYAERIGTVMMSTPWYEAGTFNNLVIPTAYMSCDTTESAVAAGVCLTIYKRLPGQLGDMGEVKKIHIPYKQISETTGSMPRMQWQNSNSIQYLWFDVKYEYKFEVTLEKLSGGTYLILNAIYLQYSNNNGVHFATQVQGANGTDGLITQAVPTIEGRWWTTTISGYGAKNVSLTQAEIDGGGNTTGTILGQYATIDYAATSWMYSSNFVRSLTYGGSGSFTWGQPTIITGVGGTSDTGYYPIVTLAGFENGTNNFLTTILGMTNAMVI